MKWHHENVTVACLSTDEVHKAPGDPQDKLALLKIIKTIKENIKKHSENCQKIQTARKYTILWVMLDFWTQNTMQKESLHLDL